MCAGCFESLPYLLTENNVQEVAGGMEHVHSEGIVHNDLASRNILLSPREDGRIVAKVRQFSVLSFFYQH